MNPPRPTEAIRHLRHAARLAIRGHGGAEPNPCVGCVITDKQGAVVGEGFHARVGGPHAEVHALLAARGAARGGTAYVTLEPCAHHGRTPPCTDALIEAGIARVVAARRDPTAEAGGGGEQLRRAGITFDVLKEPHAHGVSDPWVRRVTEGLPFVTVKWAQTLDGRIASRTGDSKWISSPRSRAMVHRERGRSDVILTGIGTVLADDPHLVARDVHPRRVARRVVVDPILRLPPDARLLRTLDEAPLTLAVSMMAERQHPQRIASLRASGVDIFVAPPQGTNADAENAAEIDLEDLLRDLTSRFTATHVLVEAGQGLMSRLFQADLVQRIWTFTAPRLMGDPEAMAPLRLGVQTHVAKGRQLRLLDLRLRDGDVSMVHALAERS